MNLGSALSIKVIFAIIVSYVLTLAIIYWIRPHAATFYLQDVPSGRKQHKAPTPVIGGIGVVIAFFLVALSFGYATFVHPAFWVAALFLFFVGLLDDMREFGSKIKFLAQAVAAIMMIFWGHVKLVDLGDLFGTGEVFLGVWGIPLTIFGVMGVVNAFNMIDGIDGLCGTQSIVPIISFAIVFLLAGQMLSVIVLIILVSAIIGFLTLNIRLPKRTSALVFFGDAGTLFLGFVIAWFSIQISGNNERIIHPAAVLWLLALPLFDTVAVMLRRFLRKSSPFKADRTHIHHLLLDMGLDDALIVKLLFMVSAVFAAFGLIGVFVLHIPDSMLFYLFLLFFALYYFAKHCLFVSVHK